MEKGIGKLMVLVLMLALAAPVQADLIVGLSTITADPVTAGEMETLTYGGTTYIVADGDLFTGTTQRYDAGGNPVEPDQYTSTNADNFSFATMTSLDNCPHLETIFDELMDTFFIFENGGNDQGSIQAILDGGGYGTAVAFNDGTHFFDTGYNSGVGGQNVCGAVFTTDVPVRGIRINGTTGVDPISISGVPEPATVALLSLGGLVLLRRRRS